ncbi:uncharacterized protein [Arachis hypogaea]|uniref:uncharacterized protein n=1 Tax=Arachis hypogaea TaxID=3818 RepID=UPI003B2176BD
MKEEPTEVPINRATRFENKVEFLDLVASESLIKKRILERFFIDLVAGESLIKEQAATRFNDKGFTLSVSPHFTRYIRASTPLSSKRSIGGASPPCTAVALNFRHTEAPSHPSRLFVCCTRRFVSNPNVQRAAVVLVLVATNSFSIHVMKKLLAVSNSGSLSVSLLQKIHGNLIKEAHDKSRSVTKAPAMKGIHTTEDRRGIEG